MTEPLGAIADMPLMIEDACLWEMVEATARAYDRAHDAEHALELVRDARDEALTRQGELQDQLAIARDCAVALEQECASLQAAVDHLAPWVASHRCACPTCDGAA